MQESGARARPIVVVAVMALMGGFFWAIRGTSGFGGSNGGMFAGLGWGLLWFLFSERGNRNSSLASPWMVAAITLGITIGGYTGYGVYISWVCGSFYLNYPTDPRPIAAWTGYAMLFLCGVHWGGITGVLMSWCLPSSTVTWWMWPIRLAAGFAGGWIALQFVNQFPQLFLPFYQEGLYQESDYATCQRALNSLRTISPHVGAFFGFLFFEVLRRNWRGVALACLISSGFALSFSIGGYWHTFQETGIPLDWWKYWEMTIGLGGGASIGLAFCLFNRPIPGFEPPTSRWLSYAIGVGVPVWWVMTKSLVNTYQGCLKIRGLEEMEPAVQQFMLLIAGSLFAVLIFLFGVFTPGKIATPHGGLHFERYTLIVLGVMVLMGFLVSLPPAMKMSNIVLVSLYGILIVGSCLIYARQRWLFRHGV